MNRFLKRLAIGVVTMAVLMGVVTAPTPAFAKQTALSAVSTPTWQTNLTAQTVAYANGYVFVGGEFTSVRPPNAAPGVGEVARNYLAIFRADTGDLVNVAPNPNGRVYSLKASEDGKTVYVGGNFTSIYGAGNRMRLAAIDTASLTLKVAFRPQVTYTVTTVDVSGDNVYFGGTFGQVNGESRSSLAAVRAADGSLLPWNPGTSGFDPSNRDNYGQVDAIKVTPDGQRVYVGGRFMNLAGQHRESIGLVDAQQGGLIDFPAANQFGNRTSGCFTMVRDIQIKDGRVYISNAGDGGGCFDGTWAADLASGQPVWTNKCLGATEVIQFVGDFLYKGSHAHNCSMEGQFGDNTPDAYGRTFHNLLAQDPNTGKIGGWYPNTNSGGKTNVGPLGMATDGSRLWIVGDFTTVNGVGQQGLTLFGGNSDSRPKLLPPVTATAGTAGTVTVKVSSALDEDDETLTYRLYRFGTTAPIDERQVTSQFWNRPAYTVTQSGLAPGSTAKYRVEVTDGTNTILSNWSNEVTVSDQVLDYGQTVKADGAQFYWPLDGTDPGSVPEVISGNTGSSANNVSFGNPGPFNNSKAVGMTQPWSWIATPQQVQGPNVFTLEAWINTTTSRGGRIVGFGNNNYSTSSNYDRQLYMGTDGKVSFGVYPGQSMFVTSNIAVNDGKWHHLAGKLGGGQIELFIDGISVGVTPGVPFAQNYAGYWKIGGDNGGGWPNGTGQTGQDPAMRGLISNVAVYPTALDPSVIRNHAVDGPWAKTISPDFTSSCVGLTCTFDASKSTSYKSQITSYTWTTDDGQTASGKTTSFTFSSAGSKSVRLEVTDDLGHRASIALPVTVVDNTLVATIAAPGCTNLDCSFDATASTTPVGSITGYSWDFGDSTPAGTGATASHSYAKAGDYTVTLTVTNDQGATAKATSTVSVKADPALNPTAAFTLSCNNLTCSFDASGSQAKGGATLSEYAWLFSNGQPGQGDARTGQKVDYTFPAGGTQTATLVVKDSRGSASTTPAQQIFSVAPGSDQILPAFTSSCNGLNCTFNSSTSTSSLGPVTDAAWVLGTTGSTVGPSPGGQFNVEKAVNGQTATVAFSSAGIKTVILRVNSGGTEATILRQLAVTDQPVQGPPTAKATASCTGLTCSFDASGSAAGQGGSIASYVWDFGDSSAPGSGVAATRTYAAAGNFTATLTVTDNLGVKATSTVAVAPVQAGPVTLARDLFNRTSKNSWGQSNQGGAWSVAGTTSRYNVNNGAAQMNMLVAGNSPGASLTGFSAQDVDLSFGLALDKPATGNGVYISSDARAVSGQGNYRLKIHYTKDNRVFLSLARVDAAGTEIALTNEVLALSAVPSGSNVLNVRFQATGNGSTTLNAKVWDSSQQEPSAWNLSKDDSTAGLQAAGAVGLRSTLSGSATNAPVVANFTNFLVTSPR